ncbi:hypothetical protein SEPCBS119000_002566 [Sporothrix epigloea]|uniref:Ubiquitin-like protease family profile domain-containing protein n=1 Tax=Sporothrix epigloea TaxID=1892477 RepID=A0ABP0DGU6_9PEZI
MSAPYNLRSADAPSGDVPPSEPPSMEELMRQLSAQMSQMQTDLTHMRTELSDQGTRLKRLERRKDPAQVPAPTTDLPAPTPVAKDTPPVPNTALPPAAELDAAVTDYKPDYELDRPQGWTITDEYEYFLNNRFTNAPGSKRPSEMFVQALFPPLKMQATFENRATPSNVHPKKLSLPKFTTENDIDLHTKLTNCQAELLSQSVNLRDWPAFAATSCEQTHLPIQGWANEKGFRWHHFVFAVINENGLRTYHYNRDTAFVNFEVPVPRVDTPEAIVERLCQVLTFAPAIYKTGNLRAQEFQTNMLRIDKSLDGHLLKIPDILSHQLLLTWAYKCKADATEYWANQRGLLELLKPLPAPDTPTTISRVVSDSAVLDADSSPKELSTGCLTALCYRRLEDGHLAPIPDDDLIEEDDPSDHEVFDILADESRRDIDVSFDPVVASIE